jgi:hypothetical protein
MLHSRTRSSNNPPLRGRAGPLALLLAGALALAAGAREPAADAELSFVPLRFGRDTSATPEARQAALAELARREPKPQHLVVLIHGWDDPVYQSTKEYSQIADDAQAYFQRRRERAVVLGIQWDSDAGALRDWLPKAVAFRLLNAVGLKKKLDDPYLQKVELARSVGRRGLRQTLFDLEDRFPHARVHLWIHSLGAEAAMHALAPTLTSGDPNNPFETYCPERTPRVDVLALAGADLDRDLLDRNSGWTQAQLPRLLWLTMPPFGVGRDRTLILRKLVRETPAIGDEGPRLAEAQFDALMSQRRLVFDAQAVPRDHQFLGYYNPDRLEGLVDAAIALRPQGPRRSALLADLDRVLAAPNTVAALKPFLENADNCTKLYALWRMERLVCGDSAHLQYGYSIRVASMAIKHPGELDKERQRTPCKLVREGYWPPPALKKADVTHMGRRQAPATDREAERLAASGA